MAVGGTRQKLSMIATVTNQGKARWMIIDEAFDAEKLIEFLQALIKDASKKVFLILDNLRVHHSKLVKVCVAERKDQIELFYLPSYSPQLNPEERLNADLKQEMGKRVPVRTKAKLREAANEHMSMLEKTPERVIGYFQVRRVRYAAQTSKGRSNSFAPIYELSTGARRFIQLLEGGTPEALNGQRERRLHLC